MSPYTRKTLKLMGAKSAKALTANQLRPKLRAETQAALDAVKLACQHIGNIYGLLHENPGVEPSEAGFTKDLTEVVKVLRNRDGAWLTLAAWANILQSNPPKPKQVE